MSFEETINNYKKIWYKNFLAIVQLLDLIEKTVIYRDESMDSRMNFFSLMDKELIHNKRMLKDDFWKKKIKKFKIQEGTNG